MNVNDTRVFAPSNTGTKAHAFLGSRGAKPGNLRAACRVTIQRAATGTTFISLDRARKFYSVCDNCVKLYAEAEARAEASMQPATEADDLGYVAPVDERAEAPQGAEKQCTCECTWKCDRPADEPCTCPCTCGAAPVAPEQHADLSAEDGTVTVDGDELTRRGHWADVTLADGRTYSVSMKVHRKGSDGSSTVLVDHVIYWNKRNGRSTGPIRLAGETDGPRTVGGRIWRLLVTANIA
jgi:hypothetical protein